jgi:hypothetical protein
LVSFFVVFFAALFAVCDLCGCGGIRSTFNASSSRFFSLEDFGMDEPYEIERQKLVRSVGDAMTAWSMVEDALLLIFSTALQASGYGISAAVFIAVENFRSKLEVVNATVSVRLGTSQLMRIWKKRLDETKNLSRRRNQIAHGRVLVLQTDKSKPRAVLMGVRLFGPMIDKRTTRLTLSSVESFITECGALSTRLHELNRKLPQRAKPPAKSAP